MLPGSSRLQTTVFHMMNIKRSRPAPCIILLCYVYSWLDAEIAQLIDASLWLSQSRKLEGNSAGLLALCSLQSGDSQLSEVVYVGEYPAPSAGVGRRHCRTDCQLLADTRTGHWHSVISVTALQPQISKENNNNNPFHDENIHSK